MTQHFTFPELYDANRRSREQKGGGNYERSNNSKKNSDIFVKMSALHLQSHNSNLCLWNIIVIMSISV